MIRYFCDICRAEIEKPERQIEGAHGRLKLRVIRALDGTWNGGQVCRDCVVNAVFVMEFGEQA